MTTATAQPAAGVRPATDTDAPRLATVLARSFATCPAWQWYLPPERNDRLARMERFFAFVLSGIYLRPGRDCVTTDDVTGAALWDPPDRWKLGTRDNLRMLAVVIRTFRGTAPRAIRGFGALDAGHPSSPGLERCDRERVAAYLETGRPRSRDFFAQHGFEVSDELELPGGGPPVWRMWREPNPNTGQEEPTWPTRTA